MDFNSQLCRAFALAIQSGHRVKNVVRRRRGWKRNAPRVPVAYDTLEPRCLLAAEITNVHSQLDNFRFISGPAIPEFRNVYQADVNSGATKVKFEIGELVIEDVNGSDGWSADINMSQVTGGSNLVVTSYIGTSIADQFVEQVEILDLPQWLLGDNVDYSVTAANSESGYRLDVTIRDLKIEAFTPSDWQWGFDYFETPLYDLANLRSAVEAGWELDLRSSPSGYVTVAASDYFVDIDILGEDVWEKTIPLGLSGTFGGSSSWFSGEYSIALSPQFNNDLDWLPGVSGSAALTLNLNQTIQLPYYSVAAANGLPPWVLDFRVTPSLGIGFGMEVLSNVGISPDGHFTVNSLDADTNATAIFGVAGEFLVLDGNFYKAGISGEAVVAQNLHSTYTSSQGWEFSAPGSLQLVGSVYWDRFLGYAAGQHSIEVEVLDWDFIQNEGDSPDIDPGSQSPYSPPSVENQQPLSRDPSFPSERPRQFTVELEASHQSGIEMYGVMVDRFLGGTWREVFTSYSHDRQFSIGPLAVGNYRMRTFAQNYLTGWGFDEYEYFHVPYAGPTEGADIAIRGVAWTEDYSNNARRDGDWVPEQGEDVSLKIEIQNSSDEPIRNVWGYLTTPTYTVQITEAGSFFDQIDAGESTKGTEWNVSLRPPYVQEDVPFTVVFEYLKGNQEYRQEYGFRSSFPRDGEVVPEFEIVAVDVLDSPAYSPKNNGDGIFQSGESVYLRPRLANTGNVVANEIRVEISANGNNEFDVETRARRYPDLSPNEQAYSSKYETYQVSAKDTRFAGSLDFDVRVSWADNAYLELQNAISVNVAPAAFVTTNPKAVDLGSVQPNAATEFEFDVLNTGTAPLQISNIEGLETGFSFNKTTFVIPPMGKQTVVATFNSTGVADGTPINTSVKISTSNGRIVTQGRDESVQIAGIVSSLEVSETIPTVQGQVLYPDISEYFGVWSEIRDGQADVFAFDFQNQEEIRVTNNTYWEDAPVVSQGLVAWSEYIEEGQVRILATDLSRPDLGILTVSESAFDQKILGVDNGLIAITKAYEVLETGDPNQFEIAYNLIVYRYPGNGQFVTEYSTNWTPKGSPPKPHFMRAH